MLARIVIVVGLLAAPSWLTVAALAADTATGLIQICRITTPGDAHRELTIEIPSGASFGDTGDGSDRRGTYWPLWIVTLQPMTLAPEQRCGAIPARISGNPDKHRLRVVDHRWFTPSPAEHAALLGWPGNLSLAATATSDFR